MSKSPKQASVTPIGSARRKTKKVQREVAQPKPKTLEDILTPKQLQDLKLDLISLTKSFHTKVNEQANRYGVKLKTEVDFKLETDD